MVLSFTSFYSTSIWAQAAPCTCPSGWSSYTLIMSTTCGPCEVRVCCAPLICNGPNTMVICNITTPVGFCTPPTNNLFSEIAGQLVELNPCHFPCSQDTSIVVVLGPCRAKNSLQNINGVLKNVIEQANCSPEPCHMGYYVTCDENGLITRSPTIMDNTSCLKITQPVGPNCYDVCK